MHGCYAITGVGPRMFAPGVSMAIWHNVTKLIKILASCKDCITAFLQQCTDNGQDGRCPTCSRAPVTVTQCRIVLRQHAYVQIVQESDLLEIVRTGKPEDTDSSGTVTLRKNDFRSSTKLDALLQNLRADSCLYPCHWNFHHTTQVPCGQRTHRSERSSSLNSRPS